MPRLPIRFPSYTIPGLTPEQNAVYTRNLQEIELPNPYVRMELASTQAITTAALTSPSWQVESTVFSRQAMDPITTGTTYIEIPYDGIWILDGQVRVNNGAADGNLVAHIQKISGRGTTGMIGRGDVGFNANAALGGAVPLSATAPLFKGDRVTIQTFIPGGAANAHEPGQEGTFISLTGVGVRAST